VDWPAYNCDFNTIEYLCSIRKRRIYHNKKQNSPNYDLWEEKKVTPGNVSFSKTANLT